TVHENGTEQQFLLQCDVIRETVTNTKGLNPNANIFTSSKVAAPPADKDWDGNEEFLTNGDLKQDDVAGGFSSGDSPVSASPPALALDSTSEPGPPPVFSPDPAMGEGAAAPVVAEAEAAASAAPEDVVMPPVTEVPVQLPMANGISPTPSLGDSTPAPNVSAERPMSPNTLRNSLRAQLEYYFSRENLVHDQYLQSQMDSDQYVPIATVANFNMVQKLTHDIELIVEVLRTSKQVQVDEKGEKVRPKHSRSVLMLREIPDTTPVEEVKALFNGENCPKVVSCEFAHNSYWYITFESDEDAFTAYNYLRTERKTFQDKPIMARIKAKPLMRTTAAPAPYVPAKGVNRQQPEQQNFMRQQQAAPYQLIQPMPPFVNSQQITQVPPFQLNYVPAVMPQWSTHTPSHALFDPGAMLAMNGYQATSIKPSTNNSRNMYPIRNNSRPPKPHRPSLSSDKGVPDARPLPDRPHNSTGSMSTPRVSPRNSNNHAEAMSQPLSTEDGPSASPASSKPEPISSNKRNNYRRSRRNDDGAKNSRSNPNHPNRDGKPSHEPLFELEPTSFPPLPGQVGNSSSSDAPEGNKLSDVVKGTARSRPEKEVKASAAPAVSSTPTPTPTAVPVSTPSVAATPTSAPETNSSPQAINTTPATTAPLTAAAVVSASASSTTSAVKEVGEVSAAPVSTPQASSVTATAESSAHPKVTKASSHGASPAPLKSAAEAPVAAKQATVSTAPPKSSPAPVSQEAPARLSYAQMRQRPPPNPPPPLLPAQPHKPLCVNRARLRPRPPSLHPPPPPSLHVPAPGPPARSPHAKTLNPGSSAFRVGGVLRKTETVGSRGLTGGGVTEGM
ncbi:hypothetical protein BaRGS_00002047, partial [Batillaria attramentaria]